MNRKIIFFITLFLFVISATVCCQGNQQNNTNNTEINDIQNGKKEEQNNIMYLHLGNKILTVTLVDNSSTKALKKLLTEKDITINMRDYGNFEKVGDLGASLPQNNEQITTKNGDIILYQGNQFVIYYASNSWNFTRLGRINNISQQELKNILGVGNVIVRLSLNQ